MLTLTIFGSGTFGQNLVPNYSFESVTSCPGFASQLDKAAPWFNPNAGTPELFHGCASWASYVSVPATSTGGFQYARTGDGFAGLYVFRTNIPNMREYIEVPLTSALLAGQCYYFEMFVNQPNDHELTCDGIGARFSNGVLQPPTNGFVMNLPAQIENSSGALLADTTGWMQISGYYTAQGGEDHLIIGNFRDNANTVWSFLQGNVWYENSAYLYVDDVSVTLFEPNLDLGNDTLLCDGLSILLEVNIPSTGVVWSNGTTNTTLLIDQAGIYWVDVSAGTCTIRDSIIIHTATPPSVDLGSDLFFCGEQETILDANISSGNVIWNNGDTTTSIIASVPGVYWIQVETVCGLGRDTIQLILDECSEEIFIPNAFSPNGDGINDLFYPVYDENYQLITVEIFDRWGRLVHVIENEPWDGSYNGAELPTGVYVWRYSTGSKKTYPKTGHLSLIR